MISELILFMLFCLFSSVCMVLIHYSTYEGMLNHWIRRATWSWPPFITTPLFDCFTCMCSVWGSVLWILMNVSGFMPYHIFSSDWIWYIVFTGGINAMLQLTILTRFDELQ